ncbi:hypothetical protein YC2023_004422 [Brassica napus]
MDERITMESAGTVRNRPTESDVSSFSGRSVSRLVSKLSSHSLTKLTRQIAPPTKNGHAPQPIESRKSSQSVNPYYVWTCNSTGGTTRPVKTKSISPTEETSRPVLTEGGPGDPSQAGITANAGTRLALQWILAKGFRLYSFQLPDSKSPVLLFFVTTFPCQDWVVCAPAAFLGCGSRFSGSLSGIEP